MKVLLVCIVFFTSLFSLEDRQALMDSISQHALRIGNGPNTTYSFVDPLCPKSQAFIELISTRNDLQEATSYYIFLYELPKFLSTEFIIHIYQSEDPVQTLKEIMIHEEYDIESPQITEKTKQKLESISEVAKQMNIKRRPYLLLFQEGSKYCMVSEGTAPCLEENDFD